MKKLLVVLVLLPTPAFAQIPVTDVAALTQIIRIIVQARQEYTLVQEGYNTIETMRRSLQNLERFRTPGIPIGFHDLSRWDYARDILSGLNGAIHDPYGDGWHRSVQKLNIPPGLLATLPLDVQQVVRVALATVQLTDSTAIQAANTVGASRVYHKNLQTKIDELQAEVLQSPSELTANLDKLAIAGTLRDRQQETNSQLQSSAVELMIAQEKGKREAEAEGVNMQIKLLQDSGDIWRATTAGSGEVLRNWYR